MKKFQPAPFTIGQKVNKDARAITVERKWNPSKQRLESETHVAPEGVTWTVFSSEYDQESTARDLGLTVNRNRRR